MQNDIAIKLKTLITEANNLQLNRNNPYGVVEPTIRRIGMLIRNGLGEKSHYLKELEGIQFIPVTFGLTDAPDSTYIRIFEEGKKSLVSLMEVVVEDIEMKYAKTITVSKSNPVNLEAVFVVHGHDELAKIEVARFIEQLGFKPIILHEQVSSGRTIIEKIEAHSNVGFGVVLYTPCDVGAVKTQASNLQPRARQNVVFEHGYLIGKLGRSKVCALVKDTVEKPNDVSGVVYVEMDNHHAWHVKLAKELKAAGYPVDMNKL